MIGLSYCSDSVDLVFLLLDNCHFLFIKVMLYRLHSLNDADANAHLRVEKIKKTNTVLLRCELRISAVS